MLFQYSFFDFSNAFRRFYVVLMSLIEFYDFKSFFIASLTCFQWFSMILIDFYINDYCILLIFQWFSLICLVILNDFHWLLVVCTEFLLIYQYSYWCFVLFIDFHCFQIDCFLNSLFFSTASVIFPVILDDFM